KVMNKRGLQEELGLPVDDNKFMIAIISRLTDQKGLDLVNHVIEGITDEHTQFVVLGTGEEKYENLFRHYQWKYPERVSANIYYSDNRAHKLYAAADAMLMPSRFEPCGLTQLISLRYGTVPIVRETGGLRDTVQPYNWYDNTGTGFSFANYNADEMLSAINYAKTVYFTERTRWEEIAKRGMQQDFSWARSAQRYQDLYYNVSSWW
ncbi:MAG: glycosyltransferase, partial [Clostridia bacterium]|nr:glycosyltransferase [Clostridia bacterium]